jgi:hypothetical protein
MPPIRSYTAGKFAMFLKDAWCGFLRSIEGGGVTAEVVREAAGPDSVARKHLGPVRFEPLTIEVGFGSKLLGEWIAASLAKPQRRSGSIVIADASLEAKSRHDFTSALISEIGIPACDGASKEPAYLTLKLAPEHASFAPASGKVSPGPVSKHDTTWLRSNFRLEIDGLDCKEVNKVDAITVKQTDVGRIEFPNLRLTIAEGAAQSFFDWHEDFVIKGNCDESKEKKGALVFLSPAGDELARVTLLNLGIFRLAPEKGMAGADQIRRVVVELYCERMQYVPGGAIIA